MVNHHHHTHEVPEVLQQRCHRVEGGSFAFRDTAPPEAGHRQSGSGAAEGGILTWRGKFHSRHSSEPSPCPISGLNTHYFWTRRANEPFTIYRHTARHSASVSHTSSPAARIHLQHDFGPLAQVSDATYFPLSVNCPGVVVAVTDLAQARHKHFLAYFSLVSRRLLKCVYVTQPVTRVLPVVDGVEAER